jgi:hypothetical protein
MKRRALVFLVSYLVFSSAQAGQNVLGMNFVISQPTTITEFGARDDGTPSSLMETVGVFNDQTGALVSPEAVFGPGEVGTQIGEAFYEIVPSFVLSPGDYSIISISAGGLLPGGGGGLAGGDAFPNLGNDLNLPEGGRFNFGNGFEAGGSTGPRGQWQPFILVAPDGGMTAMLLSTSLAGLVWARRRF